MCKNFTPVNYERLLTAYRYLGKTQIAMDKLIIHFMTAINHESFSVVMDHLGVLTAFIKILMLNDTVISGRLPAGNLLILH